MMYILANNKRIDIETFVFPAGEVSVKVPSLYSEKIGICAMLHSSEDVMKLLMVTDAIKRECDYKELYLVMPYIPYARQDRVCNSGEAFSLKVFADLINSCKFDHVVVTDPHSDVAPALLNNCIIVEQWEGVLSLVNCDKVFKNILSKSDIISPDAGAEKKTAKLCQKLGKEYYHRGIKHRDLSTGKLSGFGVQFIAKEFSNEKMEYIDHVAILDVPQSVLIVDDICDKGGTFIGLAKVLKERGVKTVSLFVTHGIFSASNGEQYLVDNGIDFVFSKYNWRSHE